MSCHFTHLLARRMLRASETDRSGLAQAGLSVRTSPFSLWSGEKPEHQLPDASAGTELALDVSCTLFHSYSPNFLLQGLKKKILFLFQSCHVRDDGVELWKHRVGARWAAWAAVRAL